MSKNDDELNEFIDEVTDGTERIKKIVGTPAAEGIKICITTDIWYSYSYTFSCLTGGRTVFLYLESPVM
jgi:hypothetical protein